MGITKKVRGQEIVGSSKQINLNDLQASEILTKKTTFNNAQIKAFASAPQILVPAPGANKVVVPVEVFAKLNFSVSALASANALEFRYTSSSGAKVTADLPGSFLNSTSTTLASVKAVVTAQTPVANAAIVVYQAANATGTGVNSTLDISVMYRIISM